jgi:photosystem II stability/assembly factor-like uncharacterized protein
MKRFCLAACVAVALVCLGAVVAPAAHAYVPDGNQGWYWQMPQPATDLEGVTFAGANDVWAVGAGGTIVHSTDAGATWASQNSGTLADLDGPTFPDALHGWVCGSSAPTGASSLLATSDGGATWGDVTPSGLGSSLANASLVDAQHGWLGTVGGYVYRTSDGGTTWTRKRLVVTHDQVTVDFVNALDGWALSPTILWRTTNGGTSWAIVQRFSQASKEKVDFVDSSHGFVLRQGSGLQSLLLATSDGGRRWRLLHRFGGIALDLCATSRSSVALVYNLANPNVSTLFFGPSVVVSSSDGGLRWTTRRIGLAVAPTAISGHGAAYCAVGDGVAVSSDDGATWQATSSGQRYRLVAGVAAAPGDLWATDLTGALLHSTDGATWVEQHTPVRYAQYLFGMSFPDTADGWVVGATATTGSGVIFHTSDGGASWSNQTSALAGELVGVDFNDDNNGWAISDDIYDSGSGGAVTGLERTTDGGATWTPIYLTGNPDLQAVDFITSAMGWVAGQTEDGPQAAVLKTTDGGQSWNTERLPNGTDEVSALQFLDQSDGWAVVGNGTTEKRSLLQTTDGGANWAAVTSLPNAVWPEDVHFVDANDGWVSGIGLWATTDGGRSWSEVAGGFFSAVSAVDSGHVWGFGDGIASTVSGPGGDTAPPQTLDNADWNWHRSPVTITLTPNDTGGSGLAGTQYSADGGATWQPGTTITVPAPLTHAGDAFHTFLYRSTDTAGNVEATEICGVGIDTLGPACGAPREPVAGTGKSAIVRFTASDAASGVARATVRIESRSGRVMKTLVTHSGEWFGSPMPYFWLRFTCRLKPGLYRVVVEATDRAGNRQVTVGRSWLRVRKSAPKAEAPGWPSGLPDTSQQGDSPDLRALAPRLLGASPASLLQRDPWTAESHLPLGR